MKLLRKIKYKLKYYISDVPEPKKWVFIVGCSNSGTSLLHTMLSLHPSAVPPDQMYLDERGAKNIDVLKLKKQWSARFNGVNKPVLLKKSPTNTVRLRWLQYHFSPAYFIGIDSNAYAVAEGGRQKYRHVVRLGAKQWKNANTIMLEDLQKVAHSKVISDENLTEHAEQTIHGICDFLEDRSKLNQAFTTHGKTLQITNINNESFHRLSKDDIIQIREEAAERLAQLAYPTPVNL